MSDVYLTGIVHYPGNDKSQVLLPMSTERIRTWKRKQVVIWFPVFFFCQSKEIGSLPVKGQAV